MSNLLSIYSLSVCYAYIKYLRYVKIVLYLFCHSFIIIHSHTFAFKLFNPMVIAISKAYLLDFLGSSGINGFAYMTGWVKPLFFILILMIILLIILDYRNDFRFFKEFKRINSYEHNKSKSKNKR